MSLTTEKVITSWASTDGHFRRAPSSFRSTIAPNSEFTPEKGRYWLYVSYACPWAHRTLISRQLKGLEDIIGVSVVHPHMGKLGWSFAPDADTSPSYKATDVVNEPHYGYKHIRELYFAAEPNYEGRFTVPVLWDLKTKKIVNNESSEIIRIFNTAFDDLIQDKFKGLTFYPQDLQSEIDALNSWVYDTINNGVYKSGFATTQVAYESNVKPLFESLQKVEDILGKHEWLVGDKLTEADIRLFTTIVRFDPVYVGHFKCNIGTIRGNFPNINKWLRRLYWKNSAFQSTTNFEHIKQHYYWSHTQINPFRIVPVGPLPDILPLEN